jgi:hypothetical protein
MKLKQKIKITKNKQKRKRIKDPFFTIGQYNLGDSTPYKNRRELYDEHLKRKMGFKC